MKRMRAWIYVIWCLILWIPWCFKSALRDRKILAGFSKEQKEAWVEQEVQKFINVQANKYLDKILED